MIRFLLLSDLHGSLPTLPPDREWDWCLIAGDICPDLGSRLGDSANRGAAQARWLNTTFLDWLPDRCYFTWGNHDRAPLDAGDQINPKILYRAFVDEEAIIKGVRVWFSPWSNAFGWTQAYMKDPVDLIPHYNRIPQGIDLIVSHAPPYGILDTVTVESGEHLGSTEFKEALSRIRPQMVVCGHIHGGYGEGELFWTDPSPALDRTKVLNVAHMTEAYQPLNPYRIVEVE